MRGLNSGHVVVFQFFLHVPLRKNQSLFKPGVFYEFNYIKEKKD